MFLKTLAPFFYSIIAGALLPLAFAPHPFWPLALLSPAMLLLLWDFNPKQGFWLGFGYGLGMFGVGVSWVFVSIHRFGNTEIPLAIVITALLVVLLALFLASQGYVLLRFFRRKGAAFYLLGFPSSWVFFEWIRSWAFTGFPWLYLGYTQLETPLSSYAPLGSVYLVSFMVALSSGCLLYLVKQHHKSGIFLLVLIWGGGIILQQVHYTEATDSPYRVSLIQGNIAPLDKFSEKDPLGITEAVYGKLTAPLFASSDLILWPESALPLPLPYSADYLSKLDHIAKKEKTTLITGIQVINEKQEYYNSLIALGNGTGLYHKHHLLPYGDYLPFEQYLRGLINFFDLPMSSFKPGPQNQPLLHAGKLNIVPLICYEIAFPELIRTTLRDGNVIITLTEDGWFGDSWGPHQHLQIARMRALETGRYVLRATTSGITAIIDPKGKISASIPQFQATVLRGTFQAMTQDTPWVKIGLWPLLSLLLLSFIISSYLR